LGLRAGDSVVRAGAFVDHALSQRDSRRHAFRELGTLISMFAIIYYALLSLPLALGILPLLALMLFSLDALSRNTLAPLWSICVTLFVLAWIGQFIGHAIEKKRPSFFKDLQFLMIGPMWLLANLYRRLGIRF